MRVKCARRISIYSFGLGLNISKVLGEIDFLLVDFTRVDIIDKQTTLLLVPIILSEVHGKFIVELFPVGHTTGKTVNYWQRLRRIARNLKQWPNG